MKKTVVFIVILFSINSFSQIHFEKGYFINNTNQRTNCLIKNQDWKNNPTEFYYKIAENSEIEKAGINSIKEFGIFDNFKYERFTADLDRTSDNLSSADGNKNSVSKKEVLFLKALVKGKATLYSYEGSNFKRFFFSTETNEATQLVYNVYLSPKTGELAKNNHYKQQLINNLKCHSIGIKKIENIKYHQADLVKLFVDYNECENVNYSTNVENIKGEFNLSIRPGMNISSLSFENNHRIWHGFNVDFEEKLSFRFGAELEFVLPFNKNKWSIILEPSYNYYSSSIYAYERQIDVDYKSIDFPLGVRHYFFLNNSDSKFFLNAALSLGKGFDSRIVLGLSEILAVQEVLKAERLRQGISMGLGYKYNNYSLEINYSTTSEILSNYHNWFSYYDKASIIIGYTIF